MNSCSISIITVTYNNAVGLAKTIDSVSNQTYTNYEHIIIDGLSHDKTHEILEEYSKKDNTICVTELDRGIYDAMNKGVNYSSGEYIIFMNAGDIFYDAHVLEKLSDCTFNEKDIVYGNSIDDYGNGESKLVKYNRTLSKWYFIKGNGICQQVIMAKRDLYINCIFDCTYPICADKKWLIQQFISGKSFEYVNIIICYYDRGGVSSKRRKQLMKESDLILKSFFPVTMSFILFLRKIKHFIFGR